MAEITWDATGEHFGETGCDHGVIYLKDSTGKYKTCEAWNGLTQVTTSPEGGEANDNYADNIKYLTLMSAENFKGSIQAFWFPKLFMQCDGTLTADDDLDGVFVSGQDRVPFGFSWRTLIVNDDKGTSFGYRIHLAYGCLASPSSQDNQTVNDSPSLKEFSWDFSGTPVVVPGRKASAYLCVDSRYADAKVLKKLEDTLYGRSGDPELPLPTELITLLKAAKNG